MKKKSTLKALNQEVIKNLLAGHYADQGSAQPTLNSRKAAVLVPLAMINGEWHILLTRRSEVVNDHKGQVSFPGGSVELSDVDAIAAALREANEEIGLDARDVEILGELDAFDTISHFVVKPVVAYLNWPVELKPNPAEVARIFTIPLKWLIQSKNINFQEWVSTDGANHKVIIYKDYLGEKLWGISAIITVRLLHILGLIELDMDGFI